MYDKIHLPHNYLKLNGLLISNIIWILVSIAVYIFSQKIGSILVCLWLWLIMAYFHRRLNRLRILIWALTDPQRLGQHHYSLGIEEDPRLEDIAYKAMLSAGRCLFIKVFIFILALINLYYTLNIFHSVWWIKIIVMLIGFIIYTPISARPNYNDAESMRYTINYLKQQIY